MGSLQARAIRYTVLPGIFPRLRALFSGGFFHVASLIAQVYYAVRLLPPGHPYLNPINRGKFGLRHVVAQAAANLVFKWSNIDQIVIFFTILIGITLIFVQFFLVIVALVMQQSVFAMVPVKDLFFVDSIYNPGPAQDIAFMILDRVFGTKNIFDSCIEAGTGCVDMDGATVNVPATYPYPIHLALHMLLRFYSIGIFFVSVLIILYFVATIAGETAETGTPFGKRLDRGWAPLRLILFFALLVPLNIGGINAGLNAGQIITLWTAKFGSNFATNTWGRFNEKLTDTYLGKEETLIATPNIPEFRGLLQFMFVMKTCKIATEMSDTDLMTTGPYGGVQDYIVRPAGLASGAVDNPLIFHLTPYKPAQTFAKNGTIRVVFGVKNADAQASKYKDHRNFVFPFCGSIQFPTVDLDKPGTPPSGATKIQEVYYDMLREMWSDPRFGSYAECVARTKILGAEVAACSLLPDRPFLMEMVNYYNAYLQQKIEPLIKEHGDWSVPPALRKKGWAGAAIWYNKVSQMNGEVTSAVLNMPIISSYPAVMETVAKSRMEKNKNVPGIYIFDPNLAQGAPINYSDPQKDPPIASALYSAFLAFEQDEIYSSEFESSTGNGVVDTINDIFGTAGIFDMRKNPDVHPLAQLSSIGKAMMEASIRNVGIGVLSGFVSKPLNDTGKIVAKTISDFAKTIGFATLAMSFAMYYILPFMPFLYFLFAVSGWVKSIFEAVVAMPLWALAHLRIDGPGLSGQDASGGYFLLLEIFLRPVLIVVGLLASVAIFGNMVVVLHDMFELLIANVGGFDIKAETSGTVPSQIDSMRGPIDEFFLTALYVIICYLIGMSSFKLIDLIPTKILRWLGAGVATFQEGAGDPAGDVMGTTYQGTLVATGQIKGGALAVLG
ncbi:MAG: DotA/TraY family protein [Alphaproteobacteria bacterium]|nr:DotA/TraY family protein [Alphaproteobacteria bacterium]